jgi:hypothetical protein
MFRSLVVPLFGLLIVATLAPAVRAETETEAMRAEIRAMRQAYESRISALESEIKDFKASGPARKTADQKIDQALDQKSLSGGKSAGRLFENVEANAVRGSTKITLGGYTEFSYVDRGDKISEFDQNRVVMELGAQIHDRIKLYLEVEYEHGAVLEGGEETGSELELEQAWLDFSINKALNFRAGMILVPVGRYNLYHEGHINNFVDRPLVNRRIAPTTWFEEGLGFHGVPLDNDWLGISYEAYIFNPGHVDEISSSGGFRGIRGEGKSPDSDHKAGAARIAFEPARKFKTFADYLEVGVSGYITGFKGFKGENENGDELNLGGGQASVYALDATYEKWNFGVRGEVAWAHADSGANDTQKQQNGWGYYVEGYYKFWPKFLNCSPFGNDFKDPKLVFAARYDWVDLNESRLDQRDMGRVTVGIGYRPVPNTVFKFDYQIDHSPSGRSGTTLSESGEGKNTDAFLFGIATGF